MSMRLSANCAMVSNQGAFPKFMAEKYPDLEIFDRDGAVNAVRYHCGILSRSELDHNEQAGALWRDLRAEYHVWLNT